MAEIVIVCVGKLREEFMRQAAEHYLRRLRPFASVEIREVKSGPRELAQLERALDGCRAVTCLDRQGEAVSSEQLAALVRADRDAARVPLAFAIGGADGLPAGFGPPGARRLSFSKLTFPHELFRVVLLEQIYRAYTILAGTPYHSGH